MCDKLSPCFGFHANAREGLAWPGNPLPEPPAGKQGAKTRKGQLALIAQRAQR